MIGNVSIDNNSLDISLENIWRSWYRFRRGKRRTPELERFTYFLERNLFELWQEISIGSYHHGAYRTFIVNDTKRRVISVANIRDRVAHRLLYDYLNKLYDKSFIFDAWSCRKNKGLIAAITRIQGFMKSYQHGFLWRADIRKFFDNVDQDVLRALVRRKIPDVRALNLFDEVITRFPNENAAERERERE